MRRQIGLTMIMTTPIMTLQKTISIRVRLLTRSPQCVSSSASHPVVSAQSGVTACIPAMLASKAARISCSHPETR